MTDTVEGKCQFQGRGGLCGKEFSYQRRRGRPQLYCDEHKTLAQEKKDKENKIKKAIERKLKRLVNEIIENPQQLDKAYQLIEAVSELQQKKYHSEESYKIEVINTPFRKDPLILKKQVSDSMLRPWSKEEIIELVREEFFPID